MAGASAKTTYFSAYFTYLKGVYLNAILILKFLFIIDQISKKVYIIESFFEIYDYITTYIYI